MAPASLPSPLASPVMRFAPALVFGVDTWAPSGRSIVGVHAQVGLHGRHLIGCTNANQRGSPS